MIKIIVLLVAGGATGLLILIGIGIAIATYMEHLEQKKNLEKDDD